MKKILIFIIVLILLLSFKSVEASLGCLDYGMAYEDFNGYCKCMSGYVWGTNFLGKPYCISGTTYCYDKYGYNSSYNILSNSCECGYGYVWGIDLFGNKICVSGSSKCKEQYGIMSTYDSLTEKCKCLSGYLFGTDSIGRTQCISDDDYCQNKLGFNSRYNSLSDSCECNYGYEFTLKKIGSGLECVRCSTKYGINSSYNSLTKKCECDDGYTLNDDGECVEKQNNVYFILKEVDTSEKKAIIQSEYTYNYYLITYGFGCYSTSIKRYINDRIVVNLGTDFYVDMWDKIVLYDDDEVCDITSVERIDSDYTLEDSDTSVSSSINYEFLRQILEVSNNNSREKNFHLADNTIKEEKNLITKIDKNLSNRVSGNILLQVEKNGEGWYVYPDDKKKYYLGRPTDAFSIMRKLGLGATHQFITSHTIYPDHVLGKILLDVEQNGEAYYIYPKDKKAYYLGRPADAFRIMRELGLGITNDDVRKIDVGEVE